MMLSHFACLRSGSVTGSLFLIPGLGGSGDELRAFAALLEPDISIHVQQTLGVDTALQGLRIEAIAEACVADILNIQPHGNYMLAGYSFGGLVAFEAARCLLGSGRNVRLLGLIEACPDEGLSMRLIRRKLLGIIRTPVGKIRPKVVMTLRDFSFRLKVRLGIPVLGKTGAAGAPRRSVDNKIMNKVALQKYQPARTPLDVTFFKAAVRLGEFPQDPLRVWRPLVRRLTVEQVPGDHHTMIRAHAESLAEAFTRRLRVALADQEQPVSPQVRSSPRPVLTRW